MTGTLARVVGRSPLLLFIVAAAVIFGLLRPGFFSLDGFLDIGQQIAVTAIVAFAMTAVIIARGIDISVGSTLAVSGIVSAQALVHGVPAPLAMLVAVGVGAAIGAVNGVLIGFLGVSPFMATLATLAFGRGAALAWSNSSSIPVDDITMLWLGGSRTGPISTSVVVAAVCLVGWVLVLRRTVYGRWLYAASGNFDAARASLVPARAVQMSTYVLAGAFAGLGAILTIGRLGSAQPLAGTGLEFAAITAAVVGGAKLAGGEGTIGGTALGAVLVGIISSGLSFLQAPQYVIYVVTGSLIILAVLLTQRATLAALTREAARSLSAGRIARRVTGRRGREGPREITLEGVGKTFPGVRALDGVTMTLRAGQVVALAGENGAGKSTLVKLLAGVHQPDSGELRLDGRPVRFRSPPEAQSAGISVIHQHFSLVPDLTVAENMFLGRELTIPGLRVLRRAAMRARARRILAELDLAIDESTPVAGLTVGQRQMVEVAGAMLTDSWLVIMDEPTSALSNRERDQLFAMVRRLSRRGVAVLYISHKIEEIFSLTDRVVVLRDGTFAGEAQTAELDEASLIAMMVGRTIEHVFPHVDVAAGEVLLEVDGLADGRVLRAASLAVRAGEVVALSGLMGSGRTELLKAVAGLSHPTAGAVRVAGRDLPLGSAPAANLAGVAYVPEDRHEEGVIPAMSVRDNIVLAWLRRHARRGLVPGAESAALAQRSIDALGVRPPVPSREVRLLSGGNQQKVVLAKWLATEPQVLLLDEPTRGVDVGAKAEIHGLIARMKERGLAVLMVSSELPEVLGVADRIVVMREGRTVGELPHGASEQDVMELAFGTARAEEGSLTS